MNTQFDISEVLQSGKIENELDFERVLITDRKLRMLTKEDINYKAVARSKVRFFKNAFNATTTLLLQRSDSQLTIKANRTDFINEPRFRN
jgi:hypothetical protein